MGHEKDVGWDIEINIQSAVQFSVGTRDGPKSEFGGAQIRSKNMDQFLPKSEQKSQK